MVVFCVLINSAFVGQEKFHTVFDILQPPRELQSVDFCTVRSVFTHNTQQFEHWGKLCHMLHVLLHIRYHKHGIIHVSDEPISHLRLIPNNFPLY
jgi:hypothetical protein